MEGEKNLSRSWRKKEQALVNEAINTTYLYHSQEVSLD
jgi:hypothetical protein